MGAAASTLSTDISSASEADLQAVLSNLPADTKSKIKTALREDQTATDHALNALFAAIDTDGSGSLDANELLSLVLSMDISDLNDEAVNSLIREVDLNGDGEVQRDEFAALLQAAEPLADAPPHLVLNFDVNQTVLMLDSAIGGDASKVLNMVLSNCAWGKMTPGEPDPRWELVSTEPSPVAPEVGLQTYAEYMMSITDVKGMTDVDQIRKTKARRRRALQGFTSEGAPGSTLGPAMAKMVEALKIPDGSSASPEELQRLGLDGGNCGLLPSFLHLLRELKRADRSFSVCFRTFGKDLPKLAAEYNALCEGTHPLFSSKDVVLDGTDGKPDMRMDLSPAGCGTYLRDGSGSISLVLGSIEQPTMELTTPEALETFYASTPGTAIVRGASAAAAKLRMLVGVPGKGRTLALRDYYPGWEATGCQAHGGKPLLLEMQHDSMQMFFDDHITSHDAHIIDVRHAAAPDANALPIGAVLGVHLVRAEPVLSISSHDYFLNAVAAAEAAWRTQAKRRAALAEALRSRASDLVSLTGGVGAANSTAPKYVPHAATDAVRRTTTYTGGDDEEEAGGTELASLDLIFIRHAECFHTAAVGMPSAIMAQYTSPDPAVKASVEPLVTHFADPTRIAQGEWKKCAAKAPFAVLTKADTPLLPSELANGAHEPRLKKTISVLAATAQPFLCASPPLLRMMSTAAIAASLAPADGPASASLRTCLTSSTMLPRPSPLHSPDDIAALTAAAKAALETANNGEVTDGARTVLGAVDSAETAAKLLTAFVQALEAYSAMHSTGGFAADSAADAAAAGSGGATAFARWAFTAAASRRVSTIVVYGGSGWWAGLIKELGASSEGLSAGELDVLLPELALDPTAVGADGSPIKLPLMAPPAGARYVRMVRHADGFGLALPSEPSVATLNPKGLEEGADRGAWLKTLLSAGEYCSY